MIYFIDGEKIGGFAFIHCKNLKSVSLHKSYDRGRKLFLASNNVKKILFLNCFSSDKTDENRNTIFSNDQLSNLLDSAAIESEFNRLY